MDKSLISFVKKEYKKQAKSILFGYAGDFSGKMESPKMKTKKQKEKKRKKAN